MSSLQKFDLENITIGADPELFAVDKRDQVVSVHDLLPGTKKNPFKVQNGAVQVDGTSAEFNIDPCHTFDEFDEKLVSVMATMQDMLSKTGLTLKALPAVFYRPDYFSKLPDEAVELGCDPDYSAYTGAENPRPTPSGAYETMRTGSGHVHIGFTEDADISDPKHFLDCRIIAHTLDLWLLPYSKLWDKDNRRALLYGKPGAFRPKAYGLEYRSLSNAWVTNPKARACVFALVKKAMSTLSLKSEVSVRNHASTIYLQRESISWSLFRKEIEYYDLNNSFTIPAFSL
jgi:hypothetical protein